MSSYDDLKSVLKDALNNKGVLNELKSKLRAEIFTILEDQTIEKPQISQENLLINELIREYMEFNHYKYSKSVFLKETNQPSMPLNREIIAAELHIKEDNTTKQVPLIYSLLWNQLNNDESTINQLESTQTTSFKMQQSFNQTNKSNDKINSKVSKNINIYKYNQDQIMD